MLVHCVVIMQKCLPRIYNFEISLLCDELKIQEIRVREETVFFLTVWGIFNKKFNKKYEKLFKFPWLEKGCIYTKTTT